MRMTRQQCNARTLSASGRGALSINRVPHVGPLTDLELATWLPFNCCSKMNENFSQALRITLTVARIQSEGRLTSIGELVNCGDDRASAKTAVIQQLVAAGILAANGPAYRLARPASSIKIHEIYSATNFRHRVRDSGMDQLFGSILSEVNAAVAQEMGGVTLDETISELLNSSPDWPNAASDR